jgi:hypothetical protein
MLKKIITYKDLDGNDVTDDFYFHLSLAELTKMHMSHTSEGGMIAYLKGIIASNDGAKIIQAFEDILGAAYGKRSMDGKSFIKKPEYFIEFMGTEAYSQFFMELVTNAEASANFINAIMPADLMKKAAERAGVEASAPEEDTRPAWLKEGRDPTKQELIDATPEQLAAAMRRRVASSGD